MAGGRCGGDVVWRRDKVVVTMWHGGSLIFVIWFLFVMTIIVNVEKEDVV